jgi:ectoine hydroxylase-related dioxygenase (phytanoyl-CoA dioxygenase family)
LTATLSSIVTPERKRQFARVGYFVTDPLFDAATLAMLRREFDALAQGRHSSDHPSAHDENLYKVRGNLFPSHLHLHNPHQRAFLHHPALVELAGAMIGPDVDETWNQAIIKPGGTGGHFSWHQDAQYAHTDPMDPGFTCWIAVTDTTVANGTLWIAPGWFERGLQPHVWNQEHHEWQCRFDGESEPPEKRPVELKAGQALIFSRLIPHASGPNTTDQPRMAYQIGYIPPGIVSIPDRKPFGDGIAVLRDGRKCT